MCDVISGLNYLKAATDMQVLSITGTNQTTFASFSLELGRRRPVVGAIASTTTYVSDATYVGA